MTIEQWQKLRGLAGMPKQKDVAILIDRLEGNIAQKEYRAEPLYWRWLIAEAALRQNCSKIEIYKRLNNGDSGP